MAKNPNVLPVDVPLVLDQKVAGMTSLSKFDLCRRDYYFYRRFRKESHQMMRGTAFHGGVKRATEHMIEAGEPTMPGEVARDFVEGYLDDHPELVVPAAERDALRLMGWNWGEATVLDLEHLQGVEIPVQFELNGWLIRMVLDLVYVFPGSHVEIEDYKTSLSMPKEEDVQRDFQLQMYALGALEGFPDGQPLPLGAGLNDVNGRLIFPRYRDKEGGFLKFRGAAFDRKDIQDFKAGLVALLDRVEENYESQEWKAVDGSHCERCTARRLCPIPRELHALPEITSEAEAIGHARLLNAKKAEVAHLQKGVRGWISATGSPLFFNSDEAYDLDLRESRSVTSWPNFDAHVKRAAELGEPYEPDQFFKRSSSTNFVKRKIKEEERDVTGE